MHQRITYVYRDSGGGASALTISPIAPSLRYTPTTIIRYIRLQLVRLSNISERKTIFSKTRFPSIFISIIIYLVYIYIYTGTTETRAKRIIFMYYIGTKLNEFPARSVQTENETLYYIIQYLCLFFILFSEN